MSKDEKKNDHKVVVDNRRARHSYAIEGTYEAGIVLQGSEVKALREGHGQIREAYAVVRDGEAFIVGMHITPYSAASTHVVVDPVRQRKLLLRKKEIEELGVQTLAKGLTLIPLKVYFTHGLVKVELGLGRGKKQVDKRRDIADRDAKRQMDRVSRRREQGR